MKTRTPDKYDRAVEYFREHPEDIEEMWGTPKSDEPSCLFLFAGDDETAILKEDQCCGCLTMIREDKLYAAQTPALTQAIRKDKRIPKNSYEITPESLPVFAQWQRKLDRYKFRKNA